MKLLGIFFVIAVLLVPVIAMNTAKEHERSVLSPLSDNDLEEKKLADEAFMTLVKLAFSILEGGTFGFCGGALAYRLVFKTPVGERMLVDPYLADIMGVVGSLVTGFWYLVSTIGFDSLKRIVGNAAVRWSITTGLSLLALYYGGLLDKRGIFEDNFRRMAAVMSVVAFLGVTGAFYHDLKDILKNKRIKQV